MTRVLRAIALPLGDSPDPVYPATLRVTLVEGNLRSKGSQREVVVEGEEEEAFLKSLVGWCPIV